MSMPIKTVKRSTRRSVSIREYMQQIPTLYDTELPIVGTGC